MPRRALRILANDWGAWIPLVAVMSLTTALVGVCANQFAWTHSPEFLAATRAAGLRAEEFHVVSVSVYCCVALVAAFSLTVVGSATVVRCAPDFSRWRLLGATPAQVGATALAMTAVACGAGALAGSLASVPASFALVPWFNGLAAQGFPGGTGGFDPPFAASPGAWAASLVLSWLTCMLGSLGPSLRAARMRPVEALRSSSAGAGGASGHPVAAAAVAALGLLLPVAGTWDPAVGGTGAGGALSSLMVWPGALLLVAVALWGARGVEAAIACAAAVPALAGSTMVVLAGKALRARAGRSAVATIPLVVAAGGGSLLLCIVRTFERVMRAMGVQTAFNYTDTTVLVGLVALFSLATAAAVTALGSDDQGPGITALRALGVPRAQASRMLVWQAALLAAATGLLSLVLALAAAGIGLFLSLRLFAVPAFCPPVDLCAVFAVASFLAVVSILRWRLAGWLGRWPALRGDTRGAKSAEGRRRRS